MEAFLAHVDTLKLTIVDEKNVSNLEMTSVEIFYDESSQTKQQLDTIFRNLSKLLKCIPKQ